MNINLDKNTENITQLTFSGIDYITKIKHCITLYYSYTTLIAIKDTDGVYYVSENIYTNKLSFIRTTGEYLDTIEPNKNNRLKREIFEKKAQVIINKIEFNPYKIILKR